MTFLLPLILKRSPYKQIVNKKVHIKFGYKIKKYTFAKKIIKTIKYVLDIRISIIR